MKKLIILFLPILFITFSCEKMNEDGLTDESFTDDAGLFSDSRATSGGGNNSGNGEQPGLITAAEWNDLSNWTFWSELINGQDFAKMPDYWSMYTSNRISVLVENNGTPVVNAKVDLLRNNVVVWTAKTDNLGYVEFLVSPYQKEKTIAINEFALSVNNSTISQTLKLFENGVNTINLNTSSNNSNTVEICFIVDATGSMSDELEFLKADLKNVIEKVANENSTLAIATSSVFYRDEGDAYVTKKSDFTTKLNNTIDFISKQSADGGGDFPEAVHSALDEAVNTLQWSTNAKTRIAFLLLDAPPHYKDAVIQDIQKNVKKAAEKGIKIIPITASGIDKETEFLMRKMAVLTNGTYVFITNDSGIGNDHIEASVGEYQVEKLNDLLVRLIKKYSN